MSWVKLDDHMPQNLKVNALSDAAFRAYVTSICYCASNLTDGFITTRQAREWAGKPRVMQEMMPGLWEVCDGGFMVHDYLKYNPTRAQVEAERAAARKRMGKPPLSEERAKRVENFARNSEAPVKPIPVPLPVLPEEPGKPVDPISAVCAKFAAYGSVTASTARAIEEDVEEFGIEWVEKAERKASAAPFEGNPAWSYVRSILERWKKQGKPDDEMENRNGKPGKARNVSGRGARSADTPEAVNASWESYQRGED